MTTAKQTPEDAPAVPAVGIPLDRRFGPLVERLRRLEIDHAPDGWPAVQMRDVSALLNALDELAAMDRTWRAAQKACEHCAPEIGEQNRRLLRVLTAAVELVCAPAWSGVSDEDVTLERVLRECGFVQPNV